MSLEQIPAKEFMRRLASIDESLNDIAKSLATLAKIENKKVPVVPERGDYFKDVLSPDVIPFPDELEEDDDDYL